MTVGEMPRLPEGATCYRTTAEFHEGSIPAGLLRDHRTKAGTWGRIVVLQGRLIYTIAGSPERSWVLTQERPGVIEPEVLHKVSPDGSVRFVVEFLREN